MRFNKRASLEIGVNTIVILVIAMMLLGLGIGFIRGLFSKAGELPGLIDTGSWENPPTASEPIKLTPSSIEIKGGDSKDVKVGVYNTKGTAMEFSVTIPSCTGGVKPKIEALSSNIPPGESKGFKVIVTAVDTKNGADEPPRLAPNKYICKLQGAQVTLNADGTTTPVNGGITYDSQFIMTVTS